MKLIKPSIEILEQTPGKVGMLRHIELAGRTCYKSENWVTEDSAGKFVDNLIASGHTSVLEHGTVYLKTKADESDFWYRNPYTEAFVIDNTAYVTTNYRVLIENKRITSLFEPYIVPRPEGEYFRRRVTVRFVCSRAIANEFVRHRVFSFSQESTRYCNYTKDKFGKELTIITPCWYIDSDDICSDDGEEEQEEKVITKLDMRKERFVRLLSTAELSYNNLIELGATPQEAREVLPLATKTELVMTGFVHDWLEFFRLRCDKAAHPDARYLANMLKEEFIKRGFISKYEVDC